MSTADPESHSAAAEKSRVPHPVDEVKGYADTARLISLDRSKSGYIFCTFAEPSTRELLYLEAEIKELLRQQHQFDMEDAACGGTLLEAAQSMYAWEEGLYDGAKDEKVRLRLRQRDEIRKAIATKVKEYRKSLEVDAIKG